MKISRKKILEVLKYVAPAISIDSEINLIFYDTGICSFSESICIWCAFDIGFECSVPAIEFRDILAKMKDEDVELGYTESSLRISGKGVEGNLMANADDGTFKLLEDMGFPDVDDEDWKKLPKGFVDGLALCVFSAAKDESVPYLSSVFVDKKRIVSSDDLRISLYEMGKGIGGSCLIPAKAVSKLLNFKIGHYILDESWIHFKLVEDSEDSEDSKGGVVFSIRLIQENYPDVRAMFDFEGVEFHFPKELKDLADTASVLADGDSDIEKRIDVRIENGKMECKGENDKGWVKSNLKITGDMKKEIGKKKIHFIITPLFFSQILSRSNSDNNTVKCGEDIIVFSFGDNFKHLISLFVE